MSQVFCHALCVSPPIIEIHYQTSKKYAVYALLFAHKPHITILVEHELEFTGWGRGSNRKFNWLFTIYKKLLKFQLGWKWNTIFQLVPLENSWDEQNFRKCSPVFPVGTFGIEMHVPFICSTCLVTVSGLLAPRLYLL